MKKTEQTFLNAARRMLRVNTKAGAHAGAGCCSVIGTSAPIERFHELFKPRDFCRAYWGLYWKDDGGKNAHRFDQAPEIRECRVLALCFMAAMEGERL